MWGTWPRFLGSKSVAGWVTQAVIGQLVELGRFGLGWVTQAVIGQLVELGRLFLEPLALMDPESFGNSTTNAPRKVRFAPKVPPRRVQNPIVPKAEKIEDADAAQAEELLRRFNETSMKAKPKVEKKSAPIRVAFGYGGTSTSIKSYGAHKGGIGSSRCQGSSSDGGGAYASGQKVHKEYKEPWDYYTYYPATLPLRRPYSGNPENLDEEEFGGASESIVYDEYSTDPATDLGLMEENVEASMFFLQLPAIMPMTKQSTNTGVREMASSLNPTKGVDTSEKACQLHELPSGFMGKMLVYRSGAIKMKLGDTLYDVSTGLDCAFAQDVVAINTEEKHCCIVGELNKRAIITPDVDSILGSIPDDL
ncbi:unnamed protein product [Ilex paraguariensis]|uniref:DNA-directed RNA polymerase III subunit RPC4 n=1 Tax=Ilex paraguariensis TaxID=185542 RepID=A0ABC8RGT3_9AQUA